MADPRKNKIATTHQEHLKQQRAKASEIKSKPNFATPGTGFKVTAPSKMYDSPAKVAKPKKEVVYQADAGKSDYSDNYGTQTSYKKTKKDASGKVKSTASADLTTGKGNVLPEFELAVTKMHGSPAKMSTVDPTTGQVLPQDLGTGPVNVANANTAQTLQKQADAEAVKQNRAGAPDRSAGAVSQSPMTMKDNFKNNSMAHAARMFGNVSNPVPSPSQFNEGLRKASAQGKLDGNPSFKSKVDAAPIKAIPIGAVIKGVQAIGALKSAAKAKGEPKSKGEFKPKGNVLPELEVEYTPATTSRVIKKPLRLLLILPLGK